VKPVATMGDNCLDRYLPPLDREFVGGNALNVAVGLRDHGHDVAYAGAVGSDRAGEAVLAAARGRGIDTAHVHAGPGATGVTTIRLTADGDRVFESEVLGESGTYRPDPATLADLASRAWVHGAGLAGGVEGFTGLRRGGARLSYDFSHASSPERMAQLCPHLEVAFLSAPGAEADEAAGLAQRPTRRRAWRRGPSPPARPPPSSPAAATAAWRSPAASTTSRRCRCRSSTPWARATHTSPGASRPSWRAGRSRPRCGLAPRRPPAHARTTAPGSPRNIETPFPVETFRDAA
jgi:hypothetical protein